MGIFLRDVVHIPPVAEAGQEDDVAAVADQIVYGGKQGLLLFRDVVPHDQHAGIILVVVASVRKPFVMAFIPAAVRLLAYQDAAHHDMPLRLRNLKALYHDDQNEYGDHH